MTEESVAVVIPAFNEHETIAAVINSVAIYATPVVVDDGSCDDTYEIAVAQGAIVIKHKTNLGYEAALSSGLQEANRRGFIFAVTMDADGQHNPEIINDFIEQLKAGSNVVIGVRDHLQRFGEYAFAWIGKYLWNIQDPLCGMKAYKLSLLEYYGPFDTTKSVGAEFVIRMARDGVSFTQIPVPTRPRFGESRYGSGLKANIRIIGALIRVIFQA
jgi:glycosyltransferase involved in cell wall biosynthesis